MVKNNTVADKGKKKRHRSPEKKAQQFDKILEVGKELFQEQGREGFTMRKLARRLNMDPNNLYNYVESKRELWIAIRKKFFEQYRNENREVIKNFNGPILDLLMEISKHFCDFAEKDYDAFQMIHIIRSPASEKMGPFEKQYKQFNFMEGTTQIIQKAIDNGEVKGKNAELLSFSLYSMLLGGTLIEKVIRDNEKLSEEVGKEVDERRQFNPQAFTSQDFRKFILDQVRMILKGSNAT